MIVRDSSLLNLHHTILLDVLVLVSLVNFKNITQSENEILPAHIRDF